MNKELARDILYNYLQEKIENTIKFMQTITIIGLYTNQIIELIEKTLLVTKMK
jgi:hypothetical protein